ncbi:MAG TPA: PDZ domain-containing protein [Thermoanaerobaculia bacterium]|nr:PDZ domain-containing protein [Thermoanaerobaculia bacterium]
MKTRLIIITLAILTLGAPALVAQQKRQTIVVRDGKVVDARGDVEWLLGGKRAFLGVVLTDLSPELREHFGAPKENGVIVSSVEENSPADKAGLRVGDIITAIDGKDINSSWALRSTLKDKKEGDSVRIEYLRGRTRQTAVASVVEKELRGATLLRGADFEEFSRSIGQNFSGPEWRARIERLGNCDELQAKLREIETRMKDLEKKLEK